MRTSGSSSSLLPARVFDLDESLAAVELTCGDVLEAPELQVRVGLLRPVEQRLADAAAVMARIHAQMVDPVLAVRDEADDRRLRLGDQHSALHEDRVGVEGQILFVGVDRRNP